MRVDIITIFPEFFSGPFNCGVIRIAQEKNAVRLNLINLRDFATDAYRTVDDYPYGGFPGMILKPEPIFKAAESVKQQDSYIILLSPQGRVLNQNIILELSKKSHLILICGRYKGVDERVRQHLINDEISIGDYILSGGEVAALVLIESIVRLLPNVVGDKESLASDSFISGLLDAPYYTRPQNFRGYKVPEILISGNHQKIKEWRDMMALKLTKEKRPDLLQSEHQDDKTKKKK